MYQKSVSTFQALLQALRIVYMQYPYRKLCTLHLISGVLQGRPPEYYSYVAHTVSGNI